MKLSEKELARVAAEADLSLEEVKLALRVSRSDLLPSMSENRCVGTGLRGLAQERTRYSFVFEGPPDEAYASISKSILQNSSGAVGSWEEGRGRVEDEELQVEYKFSSQETPGGYLIEVEVDCAPLLKRVRAFTTLSSLGLVGLLGLSVAIAGYSSVWTVGPPVVAGVLIPFILKRSTSERVTTLALRRVKTACESLPNRDGASPK